jgi:hypothetical protein
MSNWYEVQLTTGGVLHHALFLGLLASAVGSLGGSVRRIRRSNAASQRLD